MSGTIWPAYNVYSISPVNKRAFSETEDVKITLDPINKLDIYENHTESVNKDRGNKKSDTNSYRQKKYRTSLKF